MYILAHREAPQAWAQIFVASAPYVGMACEQKEPAGNRVNEVVGDFEAVARCNTKFRRDRNRLAGCGGGPSARRGFLGGQAGAATLLYLIGQLAHGFLRDGASFTSG